MRGGKGPPKGGLHDPLARDTRTSPGKVHLPPGASPLEAVDERRLKVWRMRTKDHLAPSEIAEQLGLPAKIVYEDLNNRHIKVIAAYSEEGQFWRRENNDEIERLKSVWAQYIFNPDVVVRGTTVDAEGKEKVVELSKFDAMVKIAPLYLALINIQNKMWGLYMVLDRGRNDVQDAHGSMHVKNLQVNMLQELRQIAKRENIPVTPTPEIQDSPQQ